MLRLAFPRSLTLRSLILLVAFALVASACSGGDEAVEPAEEGASGSSEAEQREPSNGEPVETGAGGLGADAIPDGVDDALVYSCAGRVVDVDSLIAGLESDVPGDDDLTAAGFDPTMIGNTSAWRLVAEANLLIGAEPLATSPPALVVIEPGGAPFGCVATRAGAFDLRQVAFEPIDGGLAIESCVDPSSVTVDRRDIDGVDVISVLAPISDDLADSCEVDGTVVVDAAAAGGEVGDGALTSFTFPFAPAQPSVWHRLGFVASPTSLDGTGLDSTPLLTVECAATSLPTEAFVEWSDVEPGFDVTVVAGGEDLFTVEFVSLDGSNSLTRAAQAYVTNAGGEVAQPIASGFLNGFSDYAAPLEPRPYSLRIDGGGGDPVEISCGEAGVSGADIAGSDSGQVPLVPLGGDLAAAQATFDNAAVSPFAYLRLVPICNGCGNGPLELQMTPSSNSSGVSHLFDPPLSEQAGAAASAIVNPFEIHDVLAQAEADGKDVQYTLDPLSGLPTRWTIDGVGGEILCFEVDTAPPDLRPDQVCETTRDLMSS